MFDLKCLLLCALVIFKNISAQLDCIDCRRIDSCEPALKIIISLKRNVTSEARKLFKNSLCGFENNIPKVCCSDFPVKGLTLETLPALETHPNVALLPNQCGNIDSHRILNRFPHIYEFPWIALIAYNTSQGLQFGCAGSIINSRYILTAGNCVKSDEGSKDIAGVRIGEYDLSTRFDCYGEKPFAICESRIQDLRVEEVIVHEEYTGRQPVHADIALIRLREPIDLSFNNAKPICLPATKELQEVSLAGKRSIVLGWGLSNHDSRVLRKFDIPILTGDACNHYYKSSQDRDNRTICAGVQKWDSCEGDSGAPLFIEELYNGFYRYVQYGVVSSSPIECNSTYPGVYTDVSKFIKWILDNIKE